MFGTNTVVTNGGKSLAISQLAGTTSTPPKYIGFGVGAESAARTASVTDTALSTEVEARDASPTVSIGTTNITNDTFQTSSLITLTSARTINELGLFTATSGGTMAFSATFPVISLGTGDKIQFTAKIIGA